MSQWLKNTIFGALILSICCPLLACSEKKDDIPEPAAIVEEVSELWVKMDGDTIFKDPKASVACDIIDKAITQYNDRLLKLKDACKSYQENASKFKPEKLIDPDSTDEAGSYLAAYILAHTMNDNAKRCTPPSANPELNPEKLHPKFDGLFKDNGCTSFLDDAAGIVTTRNRK